MNPAPLGDDASATRNDAGEAVLGEGDVGKSDAAVDGEIVNALLALFDESVTIEFPRQVGSLSVHLFEGLIERHGADGHGAVSDNPLAGFVDVVARGEVHQGVAAPLATPNGFFDFFGDVGRRGGVTDVGVNFDEEIASDDHGLSLGMVDVGRDDGASGSDFASDELGRDARRDSLRLTVHVFANGDILHLGSDDSLLRIVHLGDACPTLCS